MLACTGQILSHAIIGNVLLDIYLICCLLWVISEYYYAFFGYIDTLPLGLCLIDIVCFDNARILLCLLWLHRYFATLSYLPLGLLCLLGLPLGLFTSWATLPLGLASRAILPLGLLCLLGHFASWACLLGYFASWAISTCCHLGHVSSTLSAFTMPVY
jgi:hypothetical protein